ncbi:TSC-22/dip/bun family protein [Aphelenchoides besseyi]|nr:TSC-22/dip/bun family protein [Aphelenchoides besseyi]KAI6227096.1 TSC-22/dip/bun family protein [Aphelenchoides besseyi]
MLVEGVEMAANKPRYFQVVPVPGVFTRGRWECWDYKEGDKRTDSKANDILVFDKNSILASTNGTDHPTDGNNPATIPLTNLVTNAATLTHNGTNSASVSPSSSAIGINTENTDTIVVTSVAQNSRDAPTNVVSDSTLLESAQQFTMTSVTSGESVVLPSVDQLTIIGALDATNKPTTVVSTTSNTNGLSSSGSAKNLTKLAEETETSNIGLLATGGTNVVAIDNKIEQAMDLVKTHLTFAVREEVEQLKSTIADLEGRVTMLESENQLLKQFAPAEVVANLGSIIQTRTTVASVPTMTTITNTIAQSDQTASSTVDHLTSQSLTQVQSQLPNSISQVTSIPSNTPADDHS